MADTDIGNVVSSAAVSLSGKLKLKGFFGNYVNQGVGRFKPRLIYPGKKV